MPGYIDIKIVGDTAGVQSMLAHLERKLEPAQMGVWLNTYVEPYLQQRAGQRFANEGDDAVGAWAPLKPATEGIRASQGYGSSHPINRRSGELENYIRNTPAALTINPAGAVLTYPGTPPSGELADKVSTAQSGRGFPATVPRPVLGLGTTDVAGVLTMLAYEIQRP